MRGSGSETRLIPVLSVIPFSLFCINEAMTV